MAEEKNSQTGFNMSWFHICNCIEHEMYPKIASAVKSFINNHQHDEKKDNDENSFINLDTKTEKKLIHFLKTKRKLPIEERSYLKNLIKRARSFRPISNINRSLVKLDDLLL